MPVQKGKKVKIPAWLTKPLNEAAKVKAKRALKAYIEENNLHDDIPKSNTGTCRVVLPHM